MQHCGVKFEQRYNGFSFRKHICCGPTKHMYQRFVEKNSVTRGDSSRLPSSESLRIDGVCNSLLYHKAVEFFCAKSKVIKERLNVLIAAKCAWEIYCF